jgi:hypothetical protein
VHQLFNKIDWHQSKTGPQSFNNAEMCVKSIHKFPFNAQRRLGHNQMNVYKEKVKHTQDSELFIYLQPRTLSDLASAQIQTKFFKTHKKAMNSLMDEFFQEFSC